MYSIRTGLWLFMTTGFLLLSLTDLPIGSSVAPEELNQFSYISENYVLISRISKTKCPKELMTSGFGGLEVECWPLVPKFAGSNPEEAVGFFGREILSMPSSGGEVKESVQCPSFAACKRT